MGGDPPKGFMLIRLLNHQTIQHQFQDLFQNLCRLYPTMIVIAILRIRRRPLHVDFWQFLQAL
jgi:hypothetical protein